MLKGHYLPVFSGERKNLEKEADMTPQELSSEKDRFSTSFIGLKEDFYTDLTLETYLDAISDSEAVTPIVDSREETSAKHRGRALGLAVKKLAGMEVKGKEYVEEYVRCQHRCGCSPNTIRNSEQGMEAFIVYLQGTGKNDLEEIERTDIEGFVENEQDRGLKLSTVKTRLAIVKAFLRFMADKGLIGEEVLPWKLKIKLPETLPRAMDPEDVDRLLAAPGSERDRAMIVLLLRTGMRIGELLNTRMVDVNMTERKILIYEAQKNHLGRVVYFSDDAKAALEKWLEKRDKRQEILFYGAGGKILSYPAARMMFVKYTDRAGLSHKGYTLHSLRHTYATDLLNARMPLEVLEKLLGHRSLDVTRRYARLKDKTKEEEYFKAMEIIERRQKDGHEPCDRELQALLEETQLLPSHDQELHEHP
jgi:integrase/recombinase XerD